MQKYLENKLFADLEKKAEKLVGKKGILKKNNHYIKERKHGDETDRIPSILSSYKKEQR